MMKKQRVAIVGIGRTPKPGSCRVHQNYKEMIVESAYNAFEDAKMKPDEIQAACYAYVGESVTEDGGIAPSISNALGIVPLPVFVTSSNCTGSGVSIIQACSLIQSGEYDVVLAGGFDKMSDSYNYLEAINMSFEGEYDYMHGMSHFDAFLMGTNEYFDAYNYSEDEKIDAIASWVYEVHKNARNDEDSAFYGKPLPSKEAFKQMPLQGSTMAGGEGCSSVILVTEELAYKYTDKPVFITGVSYLVDSHYTGHKYKRLNKDMPQVVNMGVAQDAMIGAKKAFTMAGITPKDIDVAQVYDLNGSGIISLEALGICEPGQVGRFVSEGGIGLDGACPTNTDGGNIARGHISGADGANQIIELVKQLRNEAGKNQVKNAKIGVSNNIGGWIAHSTTIVLSNE